MTNRDQILKDFSEGLNAFIERTKTKAAHLAKSSSCTSAHISRMRKGEGLPSLETLCAFIDEGMSLVEIFGGERASRIVEGYQVERAKDSPIETAMQAKKILNLLLEQVGKI